MRIRTTKFRLFLLLSFSLACFSCDRIRYEEKTILVTNNSDKGIIFESYLLEKPDIQPSDTIIRGLSEEYEKNYIDPGIESHINVLIYRNKPSYLVCYIIDAEMIPEEWDYVENINEAALQKYIIPVNIMNKISFPPSQEMKDIPMWPPYGTFNN